MIKANEAKKLTNETIKIIDAEGNLNDILSFIEIKIKEACSKGNSRINIKDEEFPREVDNIQTLERFIQKEEYFVTTIKSYDEHFTLFISW